MEEILKETAKQIPALTVLAYLTYLFLKHLAVRDATLSLLLSTHAKAAELAGVIISANTKAMAENTRALDEMRRSLSTAAVSIQTVGTKIEEGIKTSNNGNKP